LKLCPDRGVSTPSSNAEGAVVDRRTALHAKVVYRLRRNGPMRTRCAEKLILSISKDASALFLLTNKRRIVEASTGIDKPWTSVRVSPMPPSRPEPPWPPVHDRSERKPRRP